MATGANFWVANLKSFIHVLAQAIVSCAQPEYYGLLATGHSMDGVTWIAVGVVALPLICFCPDVVGQFFMICQGRKGENLSP